ncbi:hypothetical protein [Pseudooceanicola nitratireducens]|uniref:hypothetical protein n=1 Tax=Pseudooceanicola nitratireducens TaxID=517719 RepID=UPI0033403396
MWRLCLILLLAGCAAPTLGFRGAVDSDHAVEGSRFKVYHSGEQAQAVLVARLSCGAPHPSCKVDAVLKGRRGFRLPVVRDCP